jgi:DNA replication licensing factor MCM2
MIRMAEASAKMALPEYVRADDIDMAISVAVQSFVSAQKMSIKKRLERVSLSVSFIKLPGL